MEAQVPERNEIHSAFAAFRRRKWTALVTFLVAFTAGASIVGFLPDIYGSYATILIEHQQIPQELVRPTVTSPLETRIQTISQEILSRSRLEALIRRFDLYPELQRELHMEELIEEMRRNINIELRGSERRRGDRTTVAFTVSFSGEDPRKVAAVTNTLASFYIEENLKVREQQAVGTADFLRLQLEQMKENLEEQEKRLSDFKEKHIGELPHHQESNLRTLEQLASRLRLNNDSQVQVNERLAALQEQLTEAQGLGVDTPDLGLTRLAEMRQELVELQRSYTERYPDVVKLKAQIAALEEQLAHRDPQSPATPAAETGNETPYVLQLKKNIAEEEARLNALKTEAERLQSSMARYQRRVENAPRLEQQYQILARDYETSKELYRSLLTRQKEAELAENMEQRQKGEQFRILDPAAASEEPAAPNRPKLLLIVLVLSLGLALGSVLLAEQLDTSFHDVEDLRGSFPHPVLAGIPEIVTPGDERQWRWRLGLAAGAMLLGLGAIVAASYLIARENVALTTMLM